MHKGPLSGIRVIEIAGIGPAPCTGMMLADMGAEVILIERKVANANAAKLSENGDASSFMFVNRGKRSIQVDLKKPAGVQLVLKLLEKADVLIEGFRPGVMERLGLGPEICLQTNPALVYGRMTGWGQSGPLAQAAGHDPNFAAISGALWYGGSPQQVPNAPLTLVGDFGGGTMMLAWGILCAVINAQKTGEGQVIDAAITDGSAYLSSLLWVMYNGGQLKDERGSGWADGAAPWSNTYACADGKFVTVCALEPQFYQELLERLELMENPLFSKQWEKANWPAAKVEMEQLFLTKTRDQWCELLEATDACFGPVLDFSEAPKHAHNIARQNFIDVNGLVQPAPAPKFSAYQPVVGAPPIPGQHGDLILQQAGFTEAEILTLRTAGVV